MGQRVMVFVACFFLVTLGLLLGGVSCADKETALQSPCTIKIAPGNYLFVAGHEFHGEVVCTWAAGDTLRIEGIPVLPRRIPPFTLSETRLEEIYGKVPYVLDLVQKGTTWHEAVDQYHQETRKVELTARRVYWRVRETSGSGKLASQAVLDSLDRSLIDPSVEPTAGYSEISFKWAGLPGTGSFLFGSTPPPPDSLRGRPWTLTEKRASEFLSTLAMDLGNDPGPVMIVLAPGGLTLVGKAVEKALSQIEAAEKGESAKGPLHDKEMEAIIAVRRGEAK